jgi:hypothetical protein
LGRGWQAGRVGEELEANGPTGGVLVVDGANVVGSRPDGWWRDRAGAAARLHGVLVAASGPGPLGDVVLVLEGAARAGVPEGVSESVRVVHAPGEGDDEIVARASGLLGARPVTVVTADRGLRARLPEGVLVRGPGWLWRLV